MSQDMKKDKILHTIAKLVVPLKRTMSPLEADSYSAPGGLENSLKKVSLLHRPTKLTSPTYEVNFPGTCTYLSRITLLLLLLLTLGVNVAWGQDTDYSGTYYIGSKATKQNNKADSYTYNSEELANNYYLCPTEGWYFYNGDNNTSNGWTETDNGKPFLTTYKCLEDGEYDVSKAVWVIEKKTNTDFYYIKQKKITANEKYRYLVSNRQITGTSSARRMRVHLEEVADETALENLGDLALFEIATVPDNLASNCLYIMPHSPNGRVNNEPYLVVNDGNYNNLKAGDTKGDGPNGTYGKNTQGTIGVYSTEPNGYWTLEVPRPVISFNASNQVEITDPTGFASAIYYTTNGDDPIVDPSNLYSAAFDPDDDVTTIKAIAIVDGQESGVATFTPPFFLGSTHNYIIQSKNCKFYNMIPNVSLDDNTKYVSTLNVPCTTMAWHFEYAEEGYYYIVDANGWYMYCTTTDNTNKYIYLKSNKDENDGYKFQIASHANGGYNIIPKGQTKAIYKNNYGNNDAGLTPVKFDGTITNDVARWDLIPYSITNLPMWEDQPFTVSTDEATNYYNIVSVSQTTKPLILNNSGLIKSEIVPTSDYDERKAMWVIKRVGQDTGGLLEYYTFQNAYTGDLLYYNGSGREIAKNASPGVLQNGMPATEGVDATWAHFVIVQTVSGYNIIPRVLVDNTKAITKNSTHEAFNCINRASGNDWTGTYYDIDNGSRWTFTKVDNVKCMEPVFTEEVNGDITITTVTNAAKILYTINDVNNPDASSTEYTAKENTSVQKVIKAIAIIGDDASTESNVVTLLNMPDITLTESEGGNAVTDDTYTYDGSAKLPFVSEVSFGEAPNKTTATAGTDYETVIDTDYSNNIYAGTAKVTLRDKESSVYVWHAEKEFTIKKAPLKVTANNHNITYGDEPTGNGVEYSGFVNGETESVIDDENLAYDYTYEQYDDVGEYTITPKGLTSDNYEIDYDGGTLTVIQKEVGLTWDPSDSSTPIATYDGQSHVPTATATGLVYEDVISVTVTPSANEGSSLTGTDAINAGSYTATASGLTGDKAGNYSLPAGNSQSFTISPKPVTVSGITVSDKTYDGTTDATIDNSGAAIDGIVSGDDLSVASVTGTFDTKDVGPDKTVTVVITTEGTSADNYELSASGLTADITPKPLTIKANDNAIGYGTAAVDYGVTYDSFVVGEDESLLEGTLTYVFNTSADGTGDAYTTSSPKGTYYIIPGGLHLPDGNNNYAITFAYGTLTVGPRKIGIGNGTDFAEGFTVNIDTSTSPYALTVYDGSTALIQGTTGTDYDYSIDTSGSTDKYYVATITGANNYSDLVTDRAIVKYAKVAFDKPDGSADDAERSALFVSDDGDNDFAKPTDKTPHIITAINDNNTVTIEPLEYIPEQEPVLLLTDDEATDFNGFYVKPRNGGDDAVTTGNLLAVQATDEEKATATVYLLYKGEFVLNKAGILKAGTVYLPVSSGSGARLKISRGGNTGIENIEYTIESQSDTWYTLDGRRLSSKPTKKGIYLQGGKKIVVK